MLHCTIEWARKALSGVFEIRIIGFASICTPMTLVGSRLHVEYDDSMVQVSIRHVELVFFLINDETRRTADILEIIASAVFSAVADLHEEFSTACEFQNLVILRPRTGEPDVVLRISIDTVLQLRPLISLSRAAPGGDKISFGVEFKDRWRSAVRGAYFIRLKRRRTMNNPYVILRIESHTCNCTNEPVIRQWLWPERINFERRNLLRALCHKDRRAYQQKKYGELSHLTHNDLSFYAR